MKQTIQVSEYLIHSNMPGSEDLTVLPSAVQQVWQEYQQQDIQAQGNDNADETITLDGVVGWDISLRLVQKVLRDAGPNGHVHMDINSPGGFFFDGVAIYNALARHKGKVTAHVLGLAGSAAHIIMMAADEIYMGEGAQQFIHNGWTVVQGNRLTMRRVANDLERIDNDIAKLIARRSTLTEKQAHALMDKETFLSADEAVDFQLADGYIKDEDNSRGKDSAQLDQGQVQGLINQLAELQSAMRVGE